MDYLCVCEPCRRFLYGCHEGDYRIINNRNGGCVNRPGCTNFWALLDSTDSCRHGARPHHVFPRLACVACVTSSQWSRWRRDLTSFLFMKASLFSHLRRVSKTCSCSEGGTGEERYVWCVSFSRTDY